MKRVLIVSDSRMPFDNNAASARMMNYARAMSENGIEVMFFSRKLYNPTAEMAEIEKGIFGYPDSDNVNKNASKFFNAIKYAVAGKESTILYYPSLNPSLEIQFILYHKLHLSGIRAVREINEVRIFNIYKPKYPSLKHLVRKTEASIADYLSRFYSGFICISQNILEYFQQFNKPSLIVPILSNCSDKTEIVHNSLKEKDKTIRFAFTGSVIIDKENLEELFKGLAKFSIYHSNWSFDMYGYCPKEESLIISKWLDEFGISDKVNFMGQVKQHEIEGRLAQADCLILPRKTLRRIIMAFPQNCRNTHLLPSRLS